MDDIKQKLADAGVTEGSWQRGEGGTKASPSLGNMTTMLEQLAVLLQHQIEQEKLRVTDLRLQQAKNKFGGGS